MIKLYTHVGTHKFRYAATPLLSLTITQLLSHFFHATVYTQEKFHDTILFLHLLWSEN